MPNCPSKTLTHGELPCHLEANHYGAHLHFADNGTTGWLDELSIPPDFESGFAELNVT